LWRVVLPKTKRAAQQPLAPPPALPDSLLHQVQLETSQQQQLAQLQQRKQLVLGAAGGDDTYDPFEPTNSPSPPPPATSLSSSSNVEGRVRAPLDVDEEATRDSAGTPVQDEHGMRLYDDDDDDDDNRRDNSVATVGENNNNNRLSELFAGMASMPGSNDDDDDDDDGEREEPAQGRGGEDLTDMFAPSPVPPSSASLSGSIVQVNLVDRRTHETLNL
jgi:hypothetical protein